MSSTVGTTSRLRTIANRALLALFFVCQIPAGAAGEPAERIPGKRNTAPAILSIAPSSGEPGTTVALYGSGFTEMTRVFLGERELTTEVSGMKHLSFEIPNLGPGTYALYLRREDGGMSRVYNFTVQPAMPGIEALEPDTIYGCATVGEREVLIRGAKFQENSQVLLDGAVIRSRFVSSDTISVTIPSIPQGLHSVQVKNPGAPASSGMALLIDGTPEITAIRQGDDFVNYYILIIEGRNFRGDSRVVVDGKSMTPSSVSIYDREKVRYVDCNRIVYERHPYDSTLKNFSVQIINVDGAESSLYQVSAP